MDSKTAAAHKATELATTTAQTNTLFLTENIVYLMGLSFIIGSLFTIFILILMDFMRRNSPKA